MGSNNGEEPYKHVNEYLKLCVRRLYDAQKQRIAADLRLQRLIREGIVIKETVEDDFKRALKYDEKAEQVYERIIARELRGLPVYEQWLSKLHGVGPRLSGLFVGLIGNIERFATAGKLWAYAGLKVVDGRLVRRAKGVKLNACVELKNTCRKFADCQVKCGGPYKELIDRHKEYLRIRQIKAGAVVWEKAGKGENWQVAYAAKSTEIPPTPKPGDLPEWTVGRINGIARWRAAKLFLSHLWEVWRELDGLPTRAPYAIEKLGHESVINPWSMISDEPVLR